MPPIPRGFRGPVHLKTFKRRIKRKKQYTDDDCWAVVALHLCGMKIIRILGYLQAAEVRMSASKIQRVISSYKKNGTVGNSTSGRPPTFTDEDIALLRAILEKDDSLYIPEVQAIFEALGWVLF